MKRILNFALCLLMLVALCIPPAAAAGEMIPYHTFLDGANLAEGMSVTYETFSKVRGAAINSHSFDTEQNCMTVTPDLGKTSMEFAITLGQDVDLKSIYSDGFLRIKTKSAAIPSKVWITVKKANQNGGQWPFSIGGWIVETDTADNWFVKDIPISGFIKQAVHNTYADVIDKIYVLFEYADGITPAPIDMAEIAIYGPDIRPKAKVITAGMNNAGKYEVNLRFDRDIDPDTFDLGVFKIGEVVAESAEYDDLYAQAKLVFDMMPDFPSEFTIDISGGMIGKNGHEVYPTVAVSNSDILATAALLDGYTCTLADDAIDFDCQVSCIYDKTGEGQSITVFVAVFNENALIAAKSSETKNIAYQSSDIFSVDITELGLSDLTDSADIRAEVYLIDSEANGRPLAKVTPVVLQ